MDQRSRVFYCQNFLSIAVIETVMVAMCYVWSSDVIIMTSAASLKLVWTRLMFLGLPADRYGEKIVFSKSLDLLMMMKIDIYLT